MPMPSGAGDVADAICIAQRIRRHVSLALRTRGESSETRINLILMGNC